MGKHKDLFHEWYEQATEEERNLSELGQQLACARWFELIKSATKQRIARQTEYASLTGQLDRKEDA